jgi:hypothetical protein
MARVTHTAFSALGTKSDVYTAGAADISMTAATPADDEEVVHNGEILLIAHNTDVGAQTVTVSSVADDLGRTGDITTYSLAADDYAVFGPFKVEGWRQTNGKLYFEATDAGVLFAVVKLPG